MKKKTIGSSDADNGRSTKLALIIWNLHNIDIKQKIRTEQVVYYRKIFCNILYRNGFTTGYISSVVNKDSSTISWYIEEGRNLTETNKTFNKQYKEIFDYFVMEGTVTQKLVEKKLREKIEVLESENKTLSKKNAFYIEYKGNKEDLDKILKIVVEKTKSGKEKEVYKKVNAILNGF